MTTLQVLENEWLRVELNPDGSAVIRHQGSDAVWIMRQVAFQDRSEINDDRAWVRNERSFCDFDSCRFRVVKNGDGSLTASVLGPIGNSTKGSVTYRAFLERDSLIFRIEAVGESLPSLCFPPSIVSDSLVIPDDVGKWVRNYEPKWECRFLMQNGGVNMRWIGGLAADEKRGWIAIIEDGYADSGFYTNNLVATPCWLRTLGRWTGEKSVRYCFSDGGYVGLAKVFRRWAREKGLLVTLREKIEKNPRIQNLLGGRIVSILQSRTPHREWYDLLMERPPADIGETDGKVRVFMSHREVAEVIRDARELGMSRGVFNLRGTWHGGYDENHPDIWPPEPALGGIGELRELLATPDPFAVLLHDNYQDIYQHVPSFPKGVIQRREGDLLTGGPWDGGLCCIMNPREALKNVRRNWEIIERELSPKGHFIDTAACVQFYQDWNPGCPMSRDDDWRAKNEIMRFYRERGMVLGSENAADFGIPGLDFLENRHTQIPGMSIPLWNLVFHDAAFLSRYGTGGTSGGRPVRELENILWGYLPMWPVNRLDEWKQDRVDFKRSLYQDRWHARVGLDEMTDHRYRSEDGMVEQTVFESGVSVIVNFSQEPRTVEGRSIGAGDFLILD